MLRGREWAWLPLAPVLAWQAVQVRRRVPRLPPARDAAGLVPGAEPEFRLLGLGDSTIAGVGCEVHAHAITGSVAAALRERLGRAIRWQALGVPGATAADVRRALLPRGLDSSADLVVLSVGVNDAVRGRSPAEFAADVCAIAAEFGSRGTRTVYAGMPPLGGFPALAPPLATLLGARARRLDAALDAALPPDVARLHFTRALEASEFATDGFHPGPRGCTRWAREIVERALL